MDLACLFVFIRQSTRCQTYPVQGNGDVCVEASAALERTVRSVIRNEIWSCVDMSKRWKVEIYGVQ